MTTRAAVVLAGKLPAGLVSAAEHEPTVAEWRQFQQHFALRKAELGECGRPYGSPCNHEHASDAPSCA